MKRAMLWGVALCILLLCCASLAAERSAGGQSQSSQVQRPREQAQNLSPEERAKLREKWATMSEQERAEARSKLRERLGGNRPGMDAGQPQSVADQIAAFKQEHQTALKELKAIRQIAAKENAVETGKALDGLIASREQMYQRRLQVLEQRMQRIEAVQKGSGKATTRTDPNSKSAPIQKEPANAGTRRRK